MKQWSLSLILLASCAHAPTIPDAIRAVNVAAAAGDVATQAAAGAWADYVDARLQICAAKELPDHAARESCMTAGGAGPLERLQVDEAFAKIVEAQRAMAAALTAAAAAYEAVRPSLEHALEKPNP